MFPSVKALVSIFTRNNINAMTSYYAVAKGRKLGIYRTWQGSLGECKSQVDKFSGPIFKKFNTSAEAQAFIDNHTKCSKQNNPSSNSAKTASNSKPKPSHDVPLGAKGSSKRARKSPKSNENSTAPTAKRMKIVEYKDELKKHVDMDSNGWVNVWTDGACSSNGNQGAKAGIGVYFGDDSPLNVSEPVVGRATNNMAEIQAVTRAAEEAHQAGITKMRINTDSTFVINCATQWMPGWKRRGWVTAAKKPVINRQELEEMEAALKPLAIQWNHVRGHHGIYGNEQADRLAREGAQRYGK